METTSKPLPCLRAVLEEDPMSVTPIPLRGQVVLQAGLSVMLWCLIIFLVLGLVTFVRSITLGPIA